MLNAHKILEVRSGEDIPSYERFQEFFKDIDVMITAETPYTYTAWNWAREAAVKTFCQPNWEFFDGLIQPNMPHPDQYLIPSYWHLGDFQERFPNSVYLPPPIFVGDFSKALLTNVERKGKKRFVHIIGRNAVYDRNGWALIMDALPYCKSDFELVVRSQVATTGVTDERVIYHIFDVEDQTEMYTDYDAMILPRRYGGLCLPMNEALCSGLPVIMTDIDPNNKVLPEEWLVPAEATASFTARAEIDVYWSSPERLAAKIDEFCNMTDGEMYLAKLKAFKIGYENYSSEVLKLRYDSVLSN